MNRRIIVLLVLVLNLVGCTKNHRDDYATVVKDLDVVDMVTRSSTTSIVRDVLENYSNPPRISRPTLNLVE